MRKTYVIVPCTAASVLVAEGSSAATVIDQNKFKGTVAATSCSTSTTVECSNGSTGTIQTDVFVSGEAFVARFSEVFPPGPQNNLFVTVVRSNGCTGEVTGSFGSVENASQQQALQSAVLRGTVPLKDFDTEVPVGSIAVDLSLEGFGDVQRDKSVLHFDFPDGNGNTVVIMIHFKGDTRAATPAGTLILDGSPLACTLNAGTLMDTKSGDKTLEHPRAGRVYNRRPCAAGWCSSRCSRPLAPTRTTPPRCSRRAASC
jgi:hypothetical protein